MIERKFATTVAILVSALAGTATAEKAYVPGETVRGGYEDYAIPFLDAHCTQCHDDVKAKADLNLLDLGPVDETNAAIWKAVWAQVALEEMPPEDKDQPEVVERLRFTDWIVAELERVMADKGGFHAHQDPHKGNFIDHDLLFGELPEGIKLTPTSSPARLWRITPQEHITRLNELINTEAPFDPAQPGVRTHGDVVPTNHGGELKLYFGTDRIIRWEGGTVAYATAVKSVPVVLSSARKHGFENYPDFYSVNSSEATQILDKAEDIIQYMAEGPSSIAPIPEQITDNPKTYDKVKPKGDLRGLPTAIVYSTREVRPMTPVRDLFEAAEVTDELLRAAVEYLFEAVTFRPASSEESAAYVGIVQDSIARVGREAGTTMGLSSIFVDRDALFRPELATTGEPDQYNRVMLQDWELGLAVNHALRYLKPDAELRQAITDGRMRSREDVEREVTRMLADPSIRKPRILRFFRDFFDHDLAGYICKDDKAQQSSGAATGNQHYRAMFDATASTDRLIELILVKDQDVLRQLLTTQQVVATSTDRTYFGRKTTPEEREARTYQQKQAMEEAKVIHAEKMSAIQDELDQLKATLKENPNDKQATKAMAVASKKLKQSEKSLKQEVAEARARIDVDVIAADLTGPEIFARVSRKSFGNGSMKPDRNLATVPEGERLGILTHPSWLVSHSDAMDNHAILRGRWVRERLLGGGIPDVPITVDAMLPDEPGTTLRSRMRVTREEYCWTCHEKMDPLGMPFEMYNHAGLYRTEELGEPVDASGAIIGSGDPELDGPVENAIDMIQKLAGSERVEQVFVRHAFRFWMGRNETLNDAPVLQAAHRAYRDSGGSMNALIASLVTSDAFLYRTVEME